MLENEEGIPGVANQEGNTDKNVFILGSAKIIKSLSSYTHEGNSFDDLKRTTCPKEHTPQYYAWKTHKVLVELENTQVIG